MPNGLLVSTAAGHTALEKCRRLLNDMNDLRAAVSDGRAVLADVRIGVAHALGEFVLTEPLGAVREEFPRDGDFYWRRDGVRISSTSYARGHSMRRLFSCPKASVCPRTCSQRQWARIAW